MKQYHDKSADLSHMQRFIYLFICVKVRKQKNRTLGEVSGFSPAGVMMAPFHLVGSVGESPMKYTVVYLERGGKMPLCYFSYSKTN